MDNSNYYDVVATNYNGQTMTSEQTNWNVPTNTTGRSIYINKNFQRKQNLPVTSNKVLINPNFLGPPKVHINPNYIKTKTIFINPLLINKQTYIEQSETLVSESKNVSDVLVSTKNKWVRISSVNKLSCCAPSTSKILKIPLKYSKYKIIRKDTTSKRKRRTSINLRYKLIRTNSIKSKTVEKHAVNNKFKLDRRNSAERIKSRLYLLNKAYRMKVDHKNAILKQRSSLLTVHNKRMSSRILNISGRKYKMDNHKMVLKLAMTGDVNTSKRTVKVRRSEQININKVPLRRSLRTINNIPCPTFHRFGVCQRHKRGMCQKVHNPDQIALCSKFLQGVCHNDACPLSHKISASKMATCKFYLEGLCTKDGCPYLHVKVNAKVAICKEFLSGFCQSGKECNKRHEFLCPDFELDGRCKKRNCQFPHKSVKRQSTDKFKLKSVRKYVNTANDNKEAGKDVVSSSDVAGSSNKRYYQEDGEVNSSTVGKLVVLDKCSTKLDLPFKRPQLGSLPTFIPF